MSETVSTLRIRTNWGVITVTIQGGCITACELPKSRHVPGAKELVIGSTDNRAVLIGDIKSAKAADRFVRAILSGKTAPVPPIRMPDGSPMQQAVWRQLLGLSKGQVVTYGEMARRVGRPRAARAAGQACGANPIPLFIPCHRVLAANGGIGGFSGGLAWKEWLLDHEAVTVAVRSKS